MAGFQLKRLGEVMEPIPGESLEAEGVLNPAAVRERSLSPAFHRTSRPRSPLGGGNARCLAESDRGRAAAHG